MFWRSLPFAATRRFKSLEEPLTPACSCLMGLVLLAMLCLGRPHTPISWDRAQGGASIGLERSGEVAALLRVTSKAQALEVRGARPVIAKFAGGHPTLSVPQAVFRRLAPTSREMSVAGRGPVSAPRVSTNQPRAPPSIRP
ncbi:hypothetical protein NKJ59_04870 [Mesorhizobium australicum]|uniref:hypothetical protein n=1 Tax=Mesorhizobium australicum TaxID=536018 RepID=UPI00333B2F0D